MTSNRKGFPYREKKKRKTTVVEDRRPHVAVRIPLRGWVQRKELEEATGNTDFHIPNLKYINDNGQRNWSRQEAHTLIEMYANIAWKDKPEFKSRMNKLAGHFLNLWERNGGLCAITKIPLLGAPGMLSYGIGIDLLQKKRGPVKGNIRLVSCPLAVTRYKYPQFCTQKVELPNTKNYMEKVNGVTKVSKYHDVSYAIAHHFYWYAKQKALFKNLPVSITFPHISRKVLIQFSWIYATPKNNTWSDMEYGPTTFFVVRLDNDIIRLQDLRTGGLRERKFSLADPNIDLFNEITKEAKMGFSRGLHISLRRDANDWRPKTIGYYGASI